LIYKPSKNKYRCRAKTYKQILDKYFKNKKLKKILGSETVIKGFYLTGAKTMLGPGVTGASTAGLYTANLILKGKLTGGKSYLK